MLDNIDSIRKSAEITLNKRAFTLREGIKYRDFTEKVTVKIGDLILSNFFGFDMEFKARIKSPASIRAKVEKQSKKFAEDQVSSDEILDINEYSLFDIYGGKIVVLNVSDSFFSKFVSIDGFLEKRIKSRKLCEVASMVSKTNPLKDKIEISRLNHVIYSEIDSICQRYVANAICEFIKNNDDLKKEFGIYNIPSRERDFNTKNEYIARHITLGSTFLPGWFMELQFKSLSDYEVARTGEAAHSSRDGKEILIPNSLSEIDMDTVQSYLIYTPNGLYVPSQMECLFYRLSSSASSDDVEKLLDLFKDFSENNNGTFKKV